MAIAHGVRTLEVIQRVAPHLNAEAEVRELESREANHQEGVTVMPGAVELVHSIPEGRWGVVTSGTRLLASARLRYCGLPVPKVLVTADDVAHGKPHPEPYLKGAELLGFDPADCLVIEDALGRWQEREVFRPGVRSDEAVEDEGVEVGDPPEDWIVCDEGGSAGVNGGCGDECVRRLQAMIGPQQRRRISNLQGRRNPVEVR
jgi:HAD superfamily hydrolase (TIGR01509 family)